MLAQDFITTLVELQDVTLVALVQSERGSVVNGNVQDILGRDISKSSERTNAETYWMDKALGGKPYWERY
jgi:hypothetical protein